jgi:hypothetical protein
MIEKQKNATKEMWRICYKNYVELMLDTQDGYKISVPTHEAVVYSRIIYNMCADLAEKGYDETNFSISVVLQNVINVGKEHLYDEHGYSKDICYGILQIAISHSKDTNLWGGWLYPLC